MNYFLSGGAKNGKSSLAQRIVCAQPGPRYYLATMIPHDDEDLLRIRRHIDDRAGLGFATVECGTDILSALRRMDPGGAVLLGGKNLSEIPEETAAAFRRDNLGFVFQDFSLLDTFSLEDNICLPLVLAGKSRTEMRDRLAPLARDLGIEPLLKKYPYEVSGGQKQRAAVARALITRPQILLADEPTGALDSRSTDELLKLFAEINHAGQTVVMVTHSVRAASCASRVLFLRDGEVSLELTRGKDTDAQFYQRIADALTQQQTGGECA